MEAVALVVSGEAGAGGDARTRKQRAASVAMAVGVYDGRVDRRRRRRRRLSGTQQNRAIIGPSTTGCVDPMELIH